MAVQVVVGRAGTGKTACCLHAIRERLREDPAEGNHLIFLVPEQAAFQMERSLIEALPGYHRCDVLSFRRLARRVLNEAGAGLPELRRPLGPMGRLMAVELLRRRREPELTVLGKAAGRSPGLLKQLAGAIDEWLQEDLDPEELRTLAEAARGRADDPHAAGRLHDLYLLYGAYREFLADGRLDPTRELAAAAVLAGSVPWLRGAEVWVDGFAGFTELERRMLVRLAALARSMTVTLLADPASPVLERADARPSPYSLFSRTERTLAALREAMQAEGIEWLPLQRLAPANPPRFVSASLGRLERRLFGPAGAGAVSGPGSGCPVHDPAAPLSPLRGSVTGGGRDPGLAPGAALYRPSGAGSPCHEGDPGDGTVRVVAAANRRIEVDAAVAEIQRLIRESGGRLRYRDIAVVVRDLEPYHDLLSAAMRAHNIPFFIDRRQPTAYHPLVELLRLLPSLVWRDFRLEDVRPLLKTGLTPLTDDEADALENYVVAHGIAGLDAWLGPAKWTYLRLFTNRGEEAELTEEAREALDRIDGYRRRLVEPLRDWCLFATATGAPSGRAWAERLVGALDRLQTVVTLDRWAAEAVERGDADEADVHRQVHGDALSLIDDLTATLGDVPLTAEEFAGVLDAAMSEFTVGLAPPTLDQVLVGSIERSRHPELEAVLILGFNEGLFPLTPGDDVLLTDDEREQLGERRPPVGTTRRQRILDEKMLAYIALTRPSRRLYISYARADQAGKELRRSPFLRDIEAALPGLNVEEVDDPTARRAMWPIGRVAELGSRLAMEFRMRPNAPTDDVPAVRARWNRLYEHARGRAAWRHDLEPILASLGYGNDARLDAGDAKRLYGQSMRFSASRIETFARCPFQHFAKYALRLEPRVEFAIQTVDLGLLHHKVLEEFYAELIHEKRDLAGLDTDAVTERLTRLSDIWIRRLTDEALLSAARNTFVLDRSNRHLRDALARQRLMARRGAFRPKVLEWSFGMEREGGPADGQAARAPLEIRTPGGRTIFVVGRVDRVDVLELMGECLGVVLDYKSSRKTMPLWKAFHGLEIQLLTYLLALAAHGRTLAGREIRPVGAFYVPMGTTRQSVKHPSDAEDPNEGIPSALKPRGIANAEIIPHLDSTLAVGAAGKSSVYSIQQKAEGALADLGYNDAYGPEDFDGILAFARRKIGALADRILDGEVAVEPCRTGASLPCSWCEFKSVCRFDYDVNRPRDAESLERQEALERMRAAAGEGSA